MFNLITLVNINIHFPSCPLYLSQPHVAQMSPLLQDPTWRSMSVYIFLSPGSSGPPAGIASPVRASYAYTGSTRDMKRHDQNMIHCHLVSVHAEATRVDMNIHVYPCLTFGEGFLQSRLLKAHMKTNIHSDGEPLACWHWGLTFQSSLRKELLRHSADVHGIKPFECQHHACSTVFQSHTDIEAHYWTHLLYHSSHCDSYCSNKTVLFQDQHHGHLGGDKLSCDFCSFVTFNTVEF